MGGERHVREPAARKELEERFEGFGESANEFVHQVSGLGLLPYRGEPGTLKDNVDIVKRVFSKWSVEIILLVYSRRSVGFGELKRALYGISPRVLSQKLKYLEELGLIEKAVTATRPPHVRYTLSAKGSTLAKLGEPVILYLRHSVR